MARNRGSCPTESGVLKCSSENSRSFHQRNLANQRERKRMMLINRGFEVLRSKLPISQLTSNRFKARKCRPTKVDILRLTIEYIKHLRAVLAGSKGDHQFGPIDKHPVFTNGRREGRRRRRSKQSTKKVEQLEPPRNELVVYSKWHNSAGSSPPVRYLLSWSRAEHSGSAGSLRPPSKNPKRVGGSRLWMPGER